MSSHVYDGRSLRERFVFRCWVKNVAKGDDGVWKISAKLESGEVDYAARKVIMAAGLSSIPNMPKLPGKEDFKGPILHQKEIGESQILTADEKDKEGHTHITVLGGGKSASDIVYAAATDSHHPRKVSWIIRTSGEGPLLLNKAQGFSKYRSVTELGSIRAMARLSSANPFLSENWWNWFLHKTAAGQWLLHKIWSASQSQSLALANYEGREGALPGFEGLRSDANIRWRFGALGILQRDDFWDVVAKRVQVYRGDIARLKEDAVVLEDGTEVMSDVLLCGTGWRQEQPFFSSEEAARIGLPVNLDNIELVKEERKHWSKLEEEADWKVLERWPYLASVPKFRTRPIHSTSYKLYNITVPITDQSIAFLGLQLVPNSYHTALAQTIYAIAMLDGAIKLPPREQMEKEVAFLNRWCTRRYPAHGSMGNIVEFEMVSFTDHLLEQLGLNSHRNKGSWWKDLTDPCLASDYAWVVDEYRRKYAQ